MSDLKIDCYDHDRTFDYISYEGLSEDELNEIMHPKEHECREDALCDILEKHGCKDVESMRWGYGIYGIHHNNGKLFITVGNSCD